MADRLKDKVALVVGAGSIGPGWGNGKAAAVGTGVEDRKHAAGPVKGIAHIVHSPRGVLSIDREQGMGYVPTPVCVCGYLHSCVEVSTSIIKT